MSEVTLGFLFTHQLIIYLYNSIITKGSQLPLLNRESLGVVFWTSINQLSIWTCFDFDALLKGFLLSRGRGDYSTKVFWYHRAPHHQVWGTGKERQTKRAQNCAPTWMNRKEEEQYQPYINSKRKYALSKIWKLFQYELLFQTLFYWLKCFNSWQEIPVCLQ